MAWAAVQAAEVSSKGAFRVAKMSAVAGGFAALITGSCGLLSVVVQGGFALEQVKITASAEAAKAQTTTPATSLNERQQRAERRAGAEAARSLALQTELATCLLCLDALPRITINTGEVLVND